MTQQRLKEIKSLFGEKDSSKRSYVKEVRAQTGPSDKNKSFGLYHYTTDAGLEGIIKSNSLRAYTCSQMDDKLEIKYGLDKIVQELDAKKGMLLRSTQLQLVERIIAIFRANNNADFFAVCVTYEGDMAEQWADYASNGNGYAIGFHFPNLFQMSNQQHFDAVYITYDAALQDQITTALVEDVLLSVINELSDSDIQNFESTIVRFAVVKGYDTAITFKHDQYKLENEFRFSTTKEYQFPILPQTYNNGLVNKYYYDFGGAHTALLPIQNIIVGRNLDFDVAKLRVEDLLRTKGHNLANVSIVQSQV